MYVIKWPGCVAFCDISHKVKHIICNARNLSIPAMLPNVSFLRPIFSTSQSPTSVNIKLVNAVRAESQIAIRSSVTPDILIIVAL